MFKFRRSYLLFLRLFLPFSYVLMSAGVHRSHKYPLQLELLMVLETDFGSYGRAVCALTVELSLQLQKLSGGSRFAWHPTSNCVFPSMNSNIMFGENCTILFFSFYNKMSGS